MTARPVPIVKNQMRPMTQARSQFDGQIVLSVRDLKTYFATDKGTVRSVDGVSFQVEAGRTLAIVGESGSGKSVTGLSIMGLVPDPPGRIAGGHIEFANRNGERFDLVGLSEESLQKIRGNEIGMIFQEPMTSLNPVFTIGEQIAESIMLHRGKSRKTAIEDAVRMLDLVSVPDPRHRVREYPHRLSGGMRQRVMIAMALSCQPKLLIADEPTTALDVTIQAQILDLLCRLQAETGMSILFITHNLGVVAEIADRVVVMYGGRILEEGATEQILESPMHPYTAGLLAAIPRSHAEGEQPGRLVAIPGNMIDLANPPSGCAFAPRCRYAQDACKAGEPPLEHIGDGRTTRCRRWRDLAL